MRRIRRFFRVLWVAYDRFNRNDGWSMSGFIAFSGLLSLFPFLIFAATLTGIMVGPERSDTIIESLFQIAPEHVALTLAPVVVEVLNKQSGEVLTLSAVFAIWAASSAVEAFRIAFDRAYAVPDPPHGNRGAAVSPVASGRPSIRLAFWIACPDDPLVRLSSAENTMTRPGRRSAITPRCT